MRNSVFALMGAAAFAVSTIPSVQAQSLSCGGSYTIKRGDTLQKLTNQVYGLGNSFFTIYNANKAVIGPNPSLIEVGMVLNIPCTGSAAPVPVAAAAPTTPVNVAPSPMATVAAPSALIPVSTSRPMRIVTGSGWAPFQDQEQEQGGMLNEIVKTAFSTQVGPEDFKIDFINDYASHLEILVADMTYDMSSAWYRPNCEVYEKLGRESQFRCDSLEFSDPVFEQIVSYYVRASENPAPKVHSDLFGKRICRPTGFAMFMMEEKDIVEPNIELVRPTSVKECFELLVNNEVDAVVLATTAADSMIGELGIRDQVVETPELATISTLHVVTAINNPNKEMFITTVNNGLKELRENGKWFEIVQRHLIEHARKTAIN